MVKQGDGLLKRTGKTLSVLVFETTKHSRIMKKRMRIGSLQKVLKADYRDLGHMVYDAIRAGRDATFLADPEFKELFENIAKHNHEMDWLRQSIARISRTKKSFYDKDMKKAGRGPTPDETEFSLEAEPQVERAKSLKSERNFLGIKKRKPRAEQALREALAAQGVKVEKPGRSFLGLGKKKAKEGVDPQTVSEEVEAAPKKPKLNFLGLKKKVEKPSKPKPKN